MAKDLQGTVKDALGKATAVPSNALPAKRRGSGGALSGATGLAAGAGAAALAPLAVKGVGKLVKNVGMDGVGDAVSAPGRAVADAKSNLGDKLSSGIGDKLSSGIGDKVSEKIESAGGPGGILKDTLKGAIGLGGDSKNPSGTGKGRRMPVQQSVDIGAPLETVYNQWTQFEDWPNFMHRVVRVTQEDDCTVSVAVKIWGKTKEFTAKIETQRPDEIVKWRTSEGMTHTGLVTFHEIGPRLTRVLLALDVDPGGFFEKAARGLRHIKRAARGDLHRFKAFIEMEEQESGGWRGTIEDGKVAKSSQQGSGSSRGRGSSGRAASNRSRSRTRGSGSTGSRSNGRSQSGSRSRSGSGASSKSRGR
jgi:uncharacterized membrane protein